MRKTAVKWTRMNNFPSMSRFQLLLCKFHLFVLAIINFMHRTKEEKKSMVLKGFYKNDWQETFPKLTRKRNIYRGIQRHRTNWRVGTDEQEWSETCRMLDLRTCSPWSFRFYFMLRWIQLFGIRITFLLRHFKKLVFFSRERYSFISFNLSHLWHR